MSDENAGVSLNLNATPTNSTPSSSANPELSFQAPVQELSKPVEASIPTVSTSPSSIKPAGEILEQGTISSNFLGETKLESSKDLPATPDLQIQPTPQVTQPESTNLYSSEDESNKKADLDEVGFDLKIKQEKPASSVDLKAGIGSVVDNIVAETTVNKENEEKILSELQQMNPDLDLDVPVAPSLNSNVDIARKIFFTILGISIIVLAYLFVNPLGGAASLTGLQDDPLAVEKEALSQTKADVIANYYVLAGMAMQDMAESVAKYAIASNTVESNFASTSEQREAKENLLEYKDTIQNSLKTVEEQLKEAKAVEQDSEDLSSELTIFLSDKVKNTKDKLEKSRLETALKLSRQDDLLANIQSIEFSELSNYELLNIMSGLLENVQTDNMNRLAYVQARRVNWTSVIDELEETTRKVDPTLSSITYSSYKLNADTRQLSVSGKIETPDEKTFTLLTLLIDELNKPDNPFINASNTSFAKTIVNSNEETNSESYSSSLRLTFNLQ